jgi:predicted ArsR family transcriptional regulator
MVNRERDEGGLFIEEVTLEDVYEAVLNGPEPASTTTDVAQALDISTEGARRKLTELHEQDRIEKRKIGARAIVWWVSE